MNTTDTYVSWPCRLKIGAKSKKGKIWTHLRFYHFAEVK